MSDKLDRRIASIVKSARQQGVHEAKGAIMAWAVAQGAPRISILDLIRFMQDYGSGPDREGFDPPPERGMSGAQRRA